MEQVKIGRFISERRKAQSLTQAQLAEMLNITDRAVSKWETGRAMPDSSIMLELCGILKITVNDLLCGEVVSVENYNKEMEKNLLEMSKQKEEADRRMLTLEIFVGVLCMAVFFPLVFIASYVNMAEWLRIVLIVIGMLPIFVACPFMLRIEQVAGYYRCDKCGHKYVPKYSSVLLAAHMGRTRHMRCPLCHEKSWQKKVLSKD